MRKVLVIVALVLALLGAGAGWSEATLPAVAHMHVLADTTPSTTTCGGGGSSYCR